MLLGDVKRQLNYTKLRKPKSKIECARKFFDGISHLRRGQAFD